MKKIRPGVLFVVVVFLGGCAPTRIVKPLSKDQQVLGVNVGGPLMGYSGSTIPMPLSAVFYGRGITNNTTAFAGVHITSLFFGVYQTEVGACTALYQNPKRHFGFSTSPVLNFSFDKWEHHLKTWPQLDVNGYWEIKPGRTMFYSGVSNWFELAKYRMNETRQTKHWFVNPHIGIQYSAGNWSFTGESKFLVPGRESLPNVVEYKGINGRGAIGIYISVSRIL